MRDSLSALLTGLFVAGLVYAAMRALDERPAARRSAAIAFLVATPVNYAGRRLLGTTD
jgi:hypothetical protein